MGLDQYFYRQDSKGELVEVGYFRKNRDLHNFISEKIQFADNGASILLNRKALDRIIVFLRKNPTSDIFTHINDCGDLELSNTYLTTMGALASYENLIYSADW